MDIGFEHGAVDADLAAAVDALVGRRFHEDAVDRLHDAFWGRIFLMSLWMVDSEGIGSAMPKPGGGFLGSL